MPEFIDIPWSIFWWPLLTAFAISLGVNYFLVAKLKGFALDMPNARSLHSSPVPRIGGVAMVIAFLSGVILFAPAAASLKALLIGLGLFSILGLADDLWRLSPWVKLTGQVVIATIVYYLGLSMGHLRNPLTDEVFILFGWLDYFLTVFWIVLLVNTVNFLDGMDGLAGGISGIAALVLGAVSLLAIVNQPETTLLCVILIGAILGFLVFNWHPAKIFMGDVGSHSLGFLIAGLAIISGTKIATAALVLGFPLVDLFWSVIRRYRAGQAPWQADKGHFHHELLNIGLSKPKVAGLLYLISLLFGVAGVLAGTALKVIAFGGAVLLAVAVLKLVMRAKNAPHRK